MTAWNAPQCILNKHSVHSVYKRLSLEGYREENVSSLNLIEATSAAPIARTYV